MPKARREVKKARQTKWTRVKWPALRLGKKGRPPVMFLTHDPVRGRNTFFVQLNRRRHVKFVAGKRWHRLECRRCGKKRVVAILHERGSKRLWVDIMAQAWIDEHKRGPGVVCARAERWLRCADNGETTESFEVRPLREGAMVGFCGEGCGWGPSDSFECVRCERQVCFCQGQWDDTPALCNDCVQLLFADERNP
jgi:hypothetical protein